MATNSFKVHFDIDEYNDNGWGIIPDIEEYMKYDEILNLDDLDKGNIDLCVWKREPEPLIITPQFIEREVTRCLRTGVFIGIKDDILWIPPNYYFFLQYFSTGGEPPQFRLKRLKHVYWKIRVRNNPFSIGTYTIKNRQDGETTIEMSDSLWEAAEGNMGTGTIGMQSKTNDTVKNSCWRILIMGWNGVPQWLKNAIYSDVDETSILTKMKFMQPKTSDRDARDIQILMGASSHNGFDSMNNMRHCKLDEINKWAECHFYKTFLNYKQFVAPGTTRKGLFSIFSSPADTDGYWNEEAYTFWKNCDPDDLTEKGTTKSRVERYYSNPLEGIEGQYDKWGDSDPDENYKHIMQERANVPKDEKMGEIRANPLNEEEMFGSYDSASTWSNSEGIKNRKIFLINRRFKEEVKKEPVNIYGNLEWKDGVVDSDVVFRQSDASTFDVEKARWCFSYLPNPDEEIRKLTYINENGIVGPFKPPLYVENCLGVDPFGKRDPKGRRSNGAMVNRKFRDVNGTGINKCPTMIYSNRPQHETTFYEDVIKSFIYNRARCQYENITAGLGEYVEDRGYFAWLLPSKGEKEGSRRTGDAPNGKGGFIDEGIGLLDAALNVPINPADQNPLDLHWFYALLEDNTKFTKKDTLKSDLTMAEIQALIGIAKLTKFTAVETSELNDAVMDYFFGD